MNVNEKKTFQVDFLFQRMRRRVYQNTYPVFYTGRDASVKLCNTRLAKSCQKYNNPI